VTINLPLLKQEIKYPIGLGDIKSKLFWFFLTKRTRHRLFVFNHSAKPMTGSSSESKLITSSTNDTFLFQAFLGSNALIS